MLTHKLFEQARPQFT